MAIRFSDVLEQMGPSDLGPLLALTAQPDIISFAGGLPAPKTFPLKELTEVAVKVREEDGAGAMQYGPSLGFLGLREAIADRMNKMYMPMGMEKVEAKNIMIVTGSQQGLDITGRVFLNKGDVVLCEARPTSALSVPLISNSQDTSKSRPMMTASFRKNWKNIWNPPRMSNSSTSSRTIRTRPDAACPSNAARK